MVLVYRIAHKISGFGPFTNLSLSKTGDGLEQQRNYPMCEPSKTAYSVIKNWIRIEGADIFLDNERSHAPTSWVKVFQGFRDDDTVHGCLTFDDIFAWFGDGGLLGLDEANFELQVWDILPEGFRNDPETRQCMFKPHMGEKVEILSLLDISK